MATVDNLLKQKLEHLLGMSGGYVLDYSNASFADFVRTSIGIDPYALHDGSKAHVLRSLWFSLSDAEFARLTIDMLEYRRLAENLGRHAQADAERSAADLQLAEEVSNSCVRCSGRLSSSPATRRRSLRRTSRSLTCRASTSR